MTHTAHPTFIAFASPKGGVGKSTSCLSIAGALAGDGQPVHIVDFDQTETLWRWYSSNPSAQALELITVEKGPAIADIKPFLKNLWDDRRGYVLIDLAGVHTNHMLQLAAFAHLTITPARLSEPDILGANKLFAQLKELGQHVGKEITHRILLNEVPPFLAAYQAHMLAQIDASQIQRFPTLMHTRAAYSEAYLTGLPAHFADPQRDTVAKAISEMNAIRTDVYDALNPTHEKAVA